jgi:Tfp pilus assembly protein PilO
MANETGMADPQAAVPVSSPAPAPPAKPKKAGPLTSLAGLVKRYFARSPLVAWTVVLGLCVVVYFRVAEPVYEYFQEMKAETQTLRRSLTAARGILAQETRRLKDEQAALKALRRSAALGKGQTPEAELKSLVKLAQSAATQAGLEVNATRELEPAEEGDLSLLRMELDVVGDFQTLHAFLLDIRDREKPVVVSGYKVRPNPKQGPPLEITIQVSRLLLR